MDDDDVGRGMSDLGASQGDVSCGVSDVKTLSDEQFDTLIDRFLAITWPVTPADVDLLLANWGWSVQRRPERGIIADTGFGFDMRRPCLIRFAETDGDVLDFGVRLSDSGRDDPAAVRDSFAKHVAVLRSRFGVPAEREPGDSPLAAWHLPSKARVVLYGSDLGEGIEVSSPEWVRVLQDAE